MKIISVRLPALLLTMAMSCAAKAEQSTAPLTITKLRTGWNDDVFTLETNSPVINPANCPTTDAYASPVGMSSPGYKTYLSAALTAYAAGKQVTIIVDTARCNQSRPAIVGIYLL